MVNISVWVDYVSLALTQALLKNHVGYLAFNCEVEPYHSLLFLRDTERCWAPGRCGGEVLVVATFSSCSCCSLSVVWVGQAWLFAACFMRAVSRELFDKQRHAVSLSSFAGSFECMGSLPGVVPLHMAGKGCSGRAERVPRWAEKLIAARGLPEASKAFPIAFFLLQPWHGFEVADV